MSKPRKAQVILEFRSQADKSAFIGGLLDGWGEGAPIEVNWKSGKSDKDGRCEIPADLADVLKVRVLEDDNAD